MNKFKAIALLAISVLGISEANATFALRRCDALGDNLDLPTAKGRVAWARKCYPHERRALAGTPEYVTIILPSNERVNGYPLFGKVDDNFNVTQVWQAPTDPNAGCEQAANWELIGACVAGCYAPDQFVEFGKGQITLEAAEWSNRHGQDLGGVVTLGPKASLEDFQLGISKLHQVVTDVQDGWHDMLQIKLQSGHLKVTTNHPLVISDGRMVRAENLKVGQSLLTRSGQADAIVDISSYRHYGKVYNVSVDSAEPTQQIVVGQGYLNGSIWYQNQAAGELNRKILRQSTILNGVLK